MEQKAEERGLAKPLRVIFGVFTIIGIVLGIENMFGITLFGFTMVNVMYYYLLFALFEFCALLIFPTRKGGKLGLWYNLALAAIIFGIFVYFAMRAYDIGRVGWVPPSAFHTALGAIVLIIGLEISRRTAGITFTLVCLLFGVYMLVADHLPGLLYGIGYSLSHAIGLCVFTTVGVIGIVGNIVGDMIMGFIVFAAVMIACGAGRFFINLALAAFGRMRGGTAKISVVASGLFGMACGVSLASVAALGSVTIPSMIKTGYPAHEAAGIQATGSAGGDFMPPVMGMVAFLMAMFLGVPYSAIVAAAFLPAILYYYALYMQVDAHAARIGLKGFPPEEIPPLRETLKEGWVFLFGIAFLVFGLLYMRWQYLAPWYAAGLLIPLSFLSVRRNWMTPRKMWDALVESGRLLATITGIIFPATLIIAALSATGVAPALTGGVLHLVGESLLPLLAVGALACYLLGMMGMMLTAYIFLAVTLAPAVVAISGISPMAIHLFIIYYCVLAVITPPVAAASFVGAAIAKCDPMKAAFSSMRFGIVIYFIPFFFVYNPALILEGPVLDTVYLFLLCLLGLAFLAAGVGGYLWKIGRLDLWARVPLSISGLLITFPESKSTIIGAVIAAVVIVVLLVRRGRSAPVAV